MVAFEKVVLKEKPSLVIVVGDVNSTLACSLVAVKRGVKVAHVEGGLRSFDRSMPEEINRLITDAISDFLFVTEQSGKTNLLREGIPEEKIFFVGNVLIDTLLANREKASQSRILEKLGLQSSNGPLDYATLTLHRPSNVDTKDPLEKIFDALVEISKTLPIVFQMHPRTRKQIEQFGLDQYSHFIEFGENQTAPFNPHKPKIFTTQPLGYLDFLHLVSNSKIVLTDSGGIQEETCILGIPCVTLRNNTERPVTVEVGTNRVTGIEKAKIIGACRDFIQNPPKNPASPHLWDGKAAERTVGILLEKLR
jgi:UDP-N-acetylglucosamine 2-epimerase (non-hydrolysing)